MGVALQEGVLVMEEEDSSASNPLANPMMDPMNMVYVFHRRVGLICYDRSCCCRVCSRAPAVLTPLIPFFNAYMRCAGT